MPGACYCLTRSRKECAMSSSRMRCAVFLAVGCFWLVGCNHNPTMINKGGEGGGSVVSINVTADGSGNCVQQVGGTGVTNAEIGTNQSAQWCAPNNSGGKDSI